MKQLPVILGILLMCLHTVAQLKTITGKVTDKDGTGMPGVSVTIKGGKTGTSTAPNGQFSIAVPQNSNKLVFSSVGYLPREITYGSVASGSQASLSVQLVAEDKGLDEVVVVGYGTKTVRENTGAVGKVTGEKISNEPLPSFNEALAGKTAGVQISMNGGALADPTNIRIRGVNSISSSSQPLIVIDGIAQIGEGNTNRIRTGGGTRFDPLSLINPNDIESIEVLKDAGSAVIYGSRASNGVILITTKKGKKGTARVTFDAKLAWSQATKKPPVLNAADYMTIQNEKASNKYGTASPNAVIALPSDMDGNGSPDNTNWMDLLYRTGMMYDNTISFSGGGDKLSVYGSARYLSQEGIVLPNKITLGQSRLNMDFTPKPWFRSGLSLSYSRTLNNGVLTDNYVQGVNISGWQAPPNVSPYNPNGPYGYNLTSGATGGYLGLGNNVSQISQVTINSQNWFNMMAMTNLTRNENTAQDTRANIYGEITPVKGLTITSKFGIQYLSNFENQYTNPSIGFWGVPYNGLLLYYTSNYAQWVFQNYATYNKTFAGNHKISIVGGAEYQHNRTQAYSMGAANLADPFFDQVVSGAFTNIQPGQTATYDQTNGDVSSSALVSYFTRAGYSFANKYLAEVSFRADAYSAFGEANQWGYFPSLSLGWEVSREKFMDNVKWLSYLKLRGSYGQVGNSRIPVYASRTLYGGAAYGTLNGFLISQFGNADLKWESSKKSNIGFDATLLNKFNIVVDVFKNDVDNLILSAPVLATAGVPNNTVSSNIGTMRNQGIEFTLNTTPVATRDFKWNTSFNFTRIGNKVLSLVNTNNNADITSGNSVASVGRPLSTYKLIRWAGVDPENGNPTWYAADGTVKEYHIGATGTGVWTDIKGTPVATGITAALDAVYLDKGGIPTWSGGWDNSITYKQLDFGINIIYSGGNYIYNSSRASMLSNNVQNNFDAILSRWTTKGQVTNVPKLYLGDNQANIASTRFLEKGDFARIRTITVGYSLGKSVLSRIGFERARLYGQAFNPFLFTGYSGMDPDINTSVRAGSNIAAGTDALGTPQPKTYTIGLNVSF